MINKIKALRKIYFGWRTVWFTGILSGIGHGFYGFGFSVFFKDLSHELGLSRAVTGIGSGIGRLEGGLWSAPAGWLADKFGPKWVMFIGVCITGVSLMLMYTIHSVWMYFVVWGFLIGSGINLSLTVTVDKTIINWFIRKRGLAQGIKFGLIGVGGVVVVPIVTWLVLWQGWRVTCLVWGILLLILSPLIMIFVKTKSPEYYGLLPDGEAVNRTQSEEVKDLIAEGAGYAASFDEIEYTFKEAWRTRAFWLFLASITINNFVNGGISIHVVPFLTDIGISKTTAGAMLSMQVFFSIPSRFFGGVLADRLSKQNLPRAIGISMMFMAFGIGLFLAYQNLFSVFVFLILMGLCGGLYTPILTVALGRYYGRNSFGAIFGVLRALQAPLAFAAPAYSGWVYDTTGSYVTAFYQFTILIVVSSVCLLSIRPPDHKGID